jgi:hypothetical protein
MATYTVTFKQLLDNYAVLQTLTDTEIEVGQSITVASVAAPFNGTFTVYALPKYEYIGIDTEGDCSLIAMSVSLTRCCSLALVMMLVE